MSTRRVDSASRLGESTRRVHESRRGETRRVGLLGYTDEARRGELRCRLVRGEARWPPTRLALSRLDSARLAGLMDISVTWKTTPRATKMRFNVTKFPSRRAPTRLAELTDISVTWQTTPRATKMRF